FEIQVDTLDEAHRRKGFATAVSAALIIYALENGLTPHWDAANEESVQLALKLGYTDPDCWEAYFLKPIVSSG
ncbi:MAG: GNAT family N-acetyltransferase, partial [Candidatus Thorarchaeota archaeon]